ncbi:MAG TPA: hypothetical protein V6D17_05265 [Candidatus Obscuribacterales bacterium]
MVTFKPEQAAAVERAVDGMEGRERQGNGDRSYLVSSNAPAVVEALDGLMASDSADRNQMVKDATQVMIDRGELSEIFLVIPQSEKLRDIASLGDDGKLDSDGDNNAKFDADKEKEWAALKSAANNGYYEYYDEKTKQTVRVDLSVAEQIAAQALVSTYTELQGGDKTISIDEDITNFASGKSNFQDKFSEEHMGSLDMAAVFGGDPTTGSYDVEKWKAIFGSDAEISKEVIEKKLYDREANLTPEQKRALEHMLADFGTIAGMTGDPSLLGLDDIWAYAAKNGVSFKDDQAEIKARSERLAPYDTALAESEDGSGAAGDDADSENQGNGGDNGDESDPENQGDEGDDGDKDDGASNESEDRQRRDELLKGLLKNDDGEPDAFALADTNNDGKVSEAEAKALLEDDQAMEQFDERQRNAVTDLYVHFDDLDSDQNGVVTVEELKKGSSFEDLTEEELREKVQELFEPVTEKEREQLLKDLFTNAPDAENDLYGALTSGNEEGEEGFDRNDIARVREAYATVYGEDSKEYKKMNERLTRVEENFDSLDRDGDGHLSEEELLGDEERSIKEIREEMNPDPKELAELIEDNYGFVSEWFGGQQNVSRRELENKLDGMSEDDPRRDLLEYALKHYDALAGQDGEAGITFEEMMDFAGVDQEELDEQLAESAEEAEAMVGPLLANDAELLERVSGGEPLTKDMLWEYLSDAEKLGNLTPLEFEALMDLYDNFDQAAAFSEDGETVDEAAVRAYARTQGVSEKTLDDIDENGYQPEDPENPDGEGKGQDPGQGDGSNGGSGVTYTSPVVQPHPYALVEASLIARGLPADYNSVFSEMNRIAQINGGVIIPDADGDGVITQQDVTNMANNNPELFNQWLEWWTQYMNGAPMPV